MKFAIALCLICHTGLDRTQDVTEDSVCILELNDVYRETAEGYSFAFRQAIFRDIDGDIIDWAMWRSMPTDNIDKIYPSGGEAVWVDSSNRLRRVKYRVFLHTITNYDDEVDSMRSTPREKRKKLSAPVRDLYIKEASNATN